jgi:hypothetical protein
MLIAADFELGSFDLTGLEWAIGCAIARLVALGAGVAAFAALLWRRRRARPEERAIVAAASVLGQCLPGTLLGFGIAFGLGEATWDVVPREWLRTLDSLWPLSLLLVLPPVLLPPWLFARRLTR